MLLDFRLYNGSAKLGCQLPQPILSSAHLQVSDKHSPHTSFPSQVTNVYHSFPNSLRGMDVLSIRLIEASTNTARLLHRLAFVFHLSTSYCIW